MEEQQRSGKRLPAPGRAAAEARPTPQPQPAPRPVPAATQPAPQPRPTAVRAAQPAVAAGAAENEMEGSAHRTRPLPGVPMTSYRPGTPRATAAPAPHPAAPPEVASEWEPAKAPVADEDDLIVEVDDALDEQFGHDLDAERAPAPQPRAKATAAAPAMAALAVENGIGVDPVEDAPTRAYSTRRALAERKNLEEDAKRSKGDEPTNLDSLKSRTESWRKLVKAKEQEGKAPYIIRILKGSFFPLLYVIISLQLLRKYTFEYSQYYSFGPIYILIGFALGAVTLLLIAARGMVRARRVRAPIVLSDKGVALGVGLFLAVSIYLAVFNGLSFAWQFSIGFFGASLLVPIVGIAIEKLSRGTFWVKEPREDEAVGKRFLEFLPAAGT